MHDAGPRFDRRGPARRSRMECIELTPARCECGWRGMHGWQVNRIDGQSQSTRSNPHLWLWGHRTLAVAMHRQRPTTSNAAHLTLTSFEGKKIKKKPKATIRNRSRCIGTLLHSCSLPFLTRRRRWMGVLGFLNFIHSCSPVGSLCRRRPDDCWTVLFAVVHLPPTLLLLLYNPTVWLVQS